MALDGSKDDDSIIEEAGFTFCIEKSLLESIGGVTIDISYMGFTIEPNNPIPSAGSSCTSCGTGGSCSV